MNNSILNKIRKIINFKYREKKVTYNQKWKIHHSVYHKRNKIKV